MTTTTQLTEHLQDHLPYELLMLRYTYARMQTETHDLVYNAMYECFCMHARNLWDFLHNEGTGNNLKVKEFAKEYRAPEDQKAQRIINFDMQRQVFHFGKSRPPKQTDKIGLEKCKTVFDYLEKAFAEFIAANWNDSSLKTKFDEDRADPAKVEQLIKKKRSMCTSADLPPRRRAGCKSPPQSTRATPGRLLRRRLRNFCRDWPAEPCGGTFFLGRSASFSGQPWWEASLPVQGLP